MERLELFDLPAQCVVDAERHTVSLPVSGANSQF
jgi:hypothetical protein